MKRSVLITGALGGIGRALCAEFKSAGWRVIATDLAPKAKAGDAYLSQDLHALRGDLAARGAFVARVRGAVGRAPLGAVINNAAVQILNPTDNVLDADWEMSLTVNLVVPFLLTQAFLPDLERAKGSVVNIASIHATQTKPAFVVYATTKAALAGMTRALAVDLGSRVRVNAISPAAISTPMLEAGFEGRAKARKELDAAHPAGRVGAPAEVACLARFLASDEARFMTGECVGIDGGIAGRLHDPV